MPTTAVSVILPVFNEADNLEPLAKDVVAALEETGRSYEVIFVDDGSTDQSLAVLKTLQRTHPSVVVIEFRRNFGQTAALAAGLRAANGEIVVTMDADRQNDPRDIAMLLKEIDQGMDLVCGWRHERKDGLWLRLLPSRVANWLISTTTDVKLHDYGCTLKAMRKDVAKKPAPLWRDAPVHPRHCELVWGSDERGQGAASCKDCRCVEVRVIPDIPRLARPADRQVSDGIFCPSDPVLWQHWHGLHGRRWWNPGVAFY